MKDLKVKDLFFSSLIDKYEETGEAAHYREKFEEWKSKTDHKFVESHGKYSVGDIIEFTAGYNNDIRYTTEILGLDESGNIFLLWDCYWFPIKDEESRCIKKLKK
jgi:hypothetical protein